MRKAFMFLSILAIATVGVMITPKDGSAAPSFARQTGTACWGCHFQYFPKLNDMGRNFKLNGFTDTSADLLEDDALSLPSPWVPVSFISKIQYVTESRKESRDPERGQERGRFKLPDEEAFYFAGRASENVGYAMEITHGEWGKASIMFPFIKGDFVVGATVYTTDGHGPATGMELGNNAALRGQRGFEQRGSVYASHAVLWNGWGGAASGLGLYGGNDLVSGYVSLWGPAWGHDTYLDTGFDLSTYVAIFITPEINDDTTVVVGIRSFGGSTTCVQCGGTDDDGNYSEHEFVTTALIVDAQIQTDLGGMSLEAFVQYASAGDKGDAKSIFKEGSATSFGVMLGITPQVGVKAAYLTHTDSMGDSDVDRSVITIGGWYNIAQNVNLSAEYGMHDGDGTSIDNDLKIMLFSGF